MKNLFDASAIFRAIKENNIEVLSENFTLDLARYELGNTVWKDCSLQARISVQESKIIMKAIKRSLILMEMLEIASSEEEILETATQLKITFYDASYTYFAKSKGLQLVTNDLRLIKKISTTINVSTLDGIK